MERRHDLDWVRVLAFGLLVIYHVGMYYVSWDWHLKSPFAGPAAQPWMVASSPWRLSLLFLVSGAATAFLLGKGEAGFVRRRSWRLLLPLAFGMLVIVPPQTYFEFVQKAGFDGGVAEFYRRYLGGDIRWDGRHILSPTWNHLWFVAYLWVYTLLPWALQRCAPGALDRARRALERALRGPGLLLWPALWLAGVRLALVGTFGSTHALVDDFYNHAQYLPCFVAGYLLARSDAVWREMARQRWVATGLALAAWLPLALAVAAYGSSGALPDPLRWAMRAVWGGMQAAAMVAVLGWAVRFAPGDSAALRYLREAVFPVYILHQTLIMLIAVALQPLRLAPAIEAPWLIALTLAGCFAIYEGVRRVRWLRPLFGLKQLRGASRDGARPLPAWLARPADRVPPQ